MLQVIHLPRKTDGWIWAVNNVMQHHYLRSAPDTRTSFETFAILLNNLRVGVLMFGRPEATRCADWYGSVEDIHARRCEVTRWQVLNLSRVWISPNYQRGGVYCRHGSVPGFIDRHGQFQSTLATSALALAIRYAPFEYLCQRPPCFLDEPYEIRWVLSYCNTDLHRGAIYRAAGFELYRTNKSGIQTWRIRVAPLTEERDRQIRDISACHPRSIKYRAERSQLKMEAM